MPSSRKRSKPPTSFVANAPTQRVTARNSHEVVSVSPESRIVLLVLGMHRTGTSVVSRALRCLGGEHSEKLMGANLGNDKGHFEDVEVYEFNKHKLLPALGVSWDSLAKPDWTRVSASQLSQLAMEALQIVRRNFGLTPVSILKEPRIGVTLQFWLSVFARAGIAVKPVFVVRDPLSVARSLRCRDGFSLSKGSALYTHYVSSISDLLPSSDAAWLHYDELLERPERVLRELAPRLGIELPGDFNRRLDLFERDFIDPTLRHSSVTLSDLGLEPDLVPASVELYSHLLARVQGQDQGELNAFAGRLREDMANWAPLFEEYDVLLREQSAASEAMKQERERFEEKLRSTESTAHETFRELQETRTLLEGARTEAQEQLSSHALARGALAERITLLTESREALEKARAREQELSGSLVQELRHSAASALAREQALTEQNEQLQQSLNHSGHQLAESLAEHQRLTERFAQAETFHAARLAELHATIQAQAGASDAAHARHQAVCEELEHSRRHSAEQITLLERERDTLKANVDERFHELTQTARMLLESDDKIAAQEAALQSQAAALEAAHAQHGALSEELEHSRRHSSALERERDSLQANVDERFRELAQIAKMIIERDDKIAAQETTLQSQAAALEAAHAQHGALSEELEHSRRHSAERMTSLERQRDALQANVDERFRELAHLAQIFMHKDMAIEDSRTAAARMKASASWKVTQPLRWFGNTFGPGAKEKKRLQRQCSLLAQSGLFDAAWYSNTYPDVVQSGIDPVEHYLRHGAREGRNPSPQFNTQNYLRRYPDVAKATPPLNPLLHYVLHGKKEGRLA